MAPDNDEAVRQLHGVVAEIRAALEKDEFVLFYQPKVNLQTGDIVGAEALIRWNHPTKGFTPPNEFLPMVENHILSIDIGEWVLHAALELEIVETSALENLEAVSGQIRECQTLGVTFSLDDFGTGFSSLSYLRRLPVQKLKIDMSFVRGMLVDANDFAIVEGVLGLARSFGLEVIAEGVETPEHSARLIEIGCFFGQGYGIARPMPGESLPAWAKNWTSSKQPVGEARSVTPSEQSSSE